ncbi:MAG: thioredoxin domain-containing protein [Alphaproteobacteria bacterium]|nr:thioredoxin domain-containing protein [Rickettsiales bacterium]
MKKSLSGSIAKFSTKVTSLLGLTDKNNHLFGIDNKAQCKLISRAFTWAKVSSFFISVISVYLILLTPLGHFVLKKYIMDNPTVLISSLQEMDRKEKEKTEQESKIAAVELAQTIPSDTSFVVIGNKAAPHTVIEFYDYSCGYCKKAAIEVKRLLSMRSDVRVVLVDYPLLNISSLLGAKVSIFIAQHYPSKMKDFHFALMEAGNVTEKSIEVIGLKLGIPKKDLENALSSNAFETTLKQNYQYGSKIYAKGTPVFIIDGKLFVGFISAEQMTGAFSS